MYFPNLVQIVGLGVIVVLGSGGYLSVELASVSLRLGMPPTCNHNIKHINSVFNHDHFFSNAKKKQL